MQQEFPAQQIAALTGARQVERIESIQFLWSGYGEIVRVRLVGRNGRPDSTAIVKHIRPPRNRNHKYGWAGDVSHQRKLKSYDVEFNWYRLAGNACDESCRIPRLIAASPVDPDADNPTGLMILEDLDAAGFGVRHRNINNFQLEACLHWLANFHATFLFDRQNSDSHDPAKKFSLWPVGTYWHLATRPDEWAAMPGGKLKQAAASIDAKLNAARFQTLIHGDAKLANFCFSADDHVAAVDFQYVGAGSGIKDFAYLISSCLSDEQCEKREDELLECYFGHLRNALESREVLESQHDAIQREWRDLYKFAWADFYRFLAGWSPGHWKMNGYIEKITQRAIEQLS